jgi:hypothetical protein
MFPDWGGQAGATPLQLPWRAIVAAKLRGFADKVNVFEGGLDPTKRVSMRTADLQFDMT